ncbi:cytochrome oxidase putative small subunit CydP [Acinetobacter sp. Ver3]|uniref:cytochrome oxidase putative small subunit CydP n=1 Tax=Acinetobacter sp. Ver3 TaxID=466088 RepID=UPI000450E723|nr:cytochrome oxidase putative small subunit CydP [Acinetobacter sp. Ver3]EZQ10481.1 hypothetical protein CL42_07215 [Acinetobacter sp. Ver3]
MMIKPSSLNKNLIKEIALILIIKVIILIVIKNIWFDAPTIPKNFDHQVAERIMGSELKMKETR